MTPQTTPRRAPAILLLITTNCVVDIQLGDESGSENEFTTCGVGEFLALPFAVDVDYDWHPLVWPIDDWWFVYPGAGASYAVSRCGEDIITLPEHVLLDGIPGEPSALYFDAHGLQRIDLAEGGKRTLLQAETRAGGLSRQDGSGGVFFEVELGQSVEEERYLKGGLSGSLMEIWRAPDLITTNASVLIHPNTLGPFEMADGWYVYTDDLAWSRIDLAVNTLVPIHAHTRFVAPNLAGDAWAWADTATSEGSGGVESFVRHVSSGEDVSIGEIPNSTLSHDVGVDWNATGTHLLLRMNESPEESWTFTFDLVGINAQTGERTPTLHASEGWTLCYHGYAETYKDGFHICRADPDVEYQLDHYYFTPAKGTTTTLDDLFWDPPPGWLARISHQGKEFRPCLPG